MITPGPWKIAAHCSTLIFDTKGRSIASAGGYQSNTESTIDENEANAQLIAAAPDLLEALEAIVGLDDSIENYQKLCDAMQSARIAISKARGES